MSIDIEFPIIVRSRRRGPEENVNYSPQSHGNIGGPFWVLRWGHILPHEQGLNPLTPQRKNRDSS